MIKMFVFTAFALSACADIPTNTPPTQPSPQSPVTLYATCQAGDFRNVCPCVDRVTKQMRFCEQTIGNDGKFYPNVEPKR